MTPSRKLIRNSLINLNAFVVLTISGLLTSGWLAQHYGLSQYGLLALARQLLPIGMLMLLDFGIPEALTSAVSRLSQANKPHLIMALLSHAMRRGLLIGAVASAALWALDDWILDALAVPGAESESFRILLFATAAALWLLITGQVAKGGLEGFERYDLVRVGEIISSLSFLFAVLVCIAMGAGYITVGIWFLATQVFRATWFLLSLRFVTRKYRREGEKVDRNEWRNFRFHAYGFLQGKTISAMFNHAPSLLLAHLGGASAVGVYDLIMRLPRAIKSLSAVANSALLPYASRQVQAEDERGPARTIRFGVLVILTVLVAPLTAMIARSEGILSLWVSEELAAFSPWLCLALLWPLITGWTGTGTSMLAAIPGEVRRLNILSLYQLGLFALTAILIVDYSEVGGVITGFVASTLLISPVQFRRSCRRFGVSFASQWEVLVRILALIFLILALDRILLFRPPYASWTPVLVDSVLLGATAWLAAWFLVWRRDDRQEMKTFVFRRTAQG